MYTSIQEITSLLKSYIHGEIHPTTHPQLRELFEKYPDLLPMVNDLIDPEQLATVLSNYRELYSRDRGDQEQQTLERILFLVEERDVAAIKRKKRMQVRYFVATLAAACLLLALGLTFFKATENTANQEARIWAKAEQFTAGTNRATLTVGNGASVDLNADKGLIVMGKVIRYDDGSVLLPEQEASAVLTLTTPKGGQYQLILSDGTKVWVNADSKLRYPKTFTGSSRVVELDGEAYFEVAKNKMNPFIVKTKNETVEVLGTHFNVNAYGNNRDSKVSLVEGKVQVSIPHGAKMVLNPGQQSVVKGGAMHVQAVNVDEIMAWKNGEFVFNNEPLATALQQLERWYDIDIQVDPALADIALWGTISRMDSFDKVLKIIKMTDDTIKINLDGRKVRLMK
ncbi:FecR family protein [Sphingobacterium sp. Mn56C]|uniref:FecR family protein n=1 Tax=Sphingobacterium sp. Mn56C TaxID=3395261 RepID=UPI003BD93A24